MSLLDSFRNVMTLVEPLDMCILFSLVQNLLGTSWPASQPASQLATARAIAVVKRD